MSFVVDHVARAIAVNVHHDLKMNAVRAARLPEGRPQRPQHVPQPPNEQLAPFQFEDLAAAPQVSRFRPLRWSAPGRRE